jgi:hypothetical protein
MRALISNYAQEAHVLEVSVNVPSEGDHYHHVHCNQNSKISNLVLQQNWKTMKRFNKVELTARYRYVITDHGRPCNGIQLVSDLYVVGVEL